MSFSARRARLLTSLDRPVLLFAGGAISRNYPANPYPFRADSSFLYFFERPEPGSAALFDPGDGTVTLFLHARTLDDALWDGARESFEAARARHGVSAVLPVEQLQAELARRAQGRQVHSLAVADARATQQARALTGEDLDFYEPARVGRPELVDAIARLRLEKDPSELAAMRRTAAVTREAHLEAMRASRPGVSEQHLAGLVEGTFARHGCTPAYGTILTARGEVLHAHEHAHTLQAGDIVLLDGGAEEIATGYCSDVTRCWPVGGPFTPEGRDVYDLVLEAEQSAIARVKPGVRFKELHLHAAQVIAAGLVSMGLLRGSPDALVEAGAHALFFPHGLGHQLGLDVHDLETFGDRVHYAGRPRSTQFGLAFLRMDLDLKAGMTFTIEPGVYFVPAILRSPDFRQRFEGQVDFARAERFLALNHGRGFGGIRIEDDVRCTETGVEVLTADVPRARADIEALTA